MTDTTRDYRASDNPNWQPYRDPNTGEVVILTPAQCAAVRHALDVWMRVVDHEREKGKPEQSDSYLYEAVQRARGAWTVINMKSCLLGRLLYDGKPPLVDAPPTIAVAPDYSLEVPR